MTGAPGLLRHLVFAALLCACDRPPSADSLREWTPSDHHSTDDGKLAAQQGPARQASAAQRPAAARAATGAANLPNPDATGATKAPLAGGDVGPLVDLTWRQQCANCHGASGRGDGQIGPMVRAPDLTLDAWQSKVSDEDIAAIIKGGKGKMPGFDVPDPVIRGLVARVRATRVR